MLEDRRSAAVLAVGMCVGLIGGAIILGHSLQEIRKGERYVTVKGVAERDVRADLGVWAMKLRVAGSDLAEAGRSMDAARAKVLQFLAEKGFAPEEIASQELRVSDRQANDYGSGNVREMLRYVVEATIVLRSKNVDRVQKVSQMTDELVRAGVVLSTKEEWQTGPRFMFTQLNSIKPAMLAEATKSSRAAAVQFATDSGSAVGSIRRASQGLFSITNRDQTTPGQGEGSSGGSEDESDPNKRVRVVVTIDYFLER
jgi:hypothetical protein